MKSSYIDPGLEKARVRIRFFKRSEPENQVYFHNFFLLFRYKVRISQVLYVQEVVTHFLYSNPANNWKVITKLAEVRQTQT